MHLGLELCSIQWAAYIRNFEDLLTESTLRIFVSSKNWLIPESNVASTDFSSLCQVLLGLETGGMSSLCLFADFRPQ